MRTLAGGASLLDVVDAGGGLEVKPEKGD